MAERRTVLVIAIGSTLVTGLLLALVFSLGGWAYHHRQLTLHDGRLRRAVDQHPSAADISGALLAEPGTRAIAVPPGDADLDRLAAQWSRARSGEVVAKRRKWADVRAFVVGGTVYFLYFDDKGLLQDYVLLND